MARAKPESLLAQNDGAMPSNIQNRRPPSASGTLRPSPFLWDGLALTTCHSPLSSQSAGPAADHWSLGRIGAFEDSSDGGQSVVRIEVRGTKPECPLASWSGAVRYHHRSRIRNFNLNRSPCQGRRPVESTTKKEFFFFGNKPTDLVESKAPGWTSPENKPTVCSKIQ
jgi:hypothetical protein